MRDVGSLPVQTHVYAILMPSKTIWERMFDVLHCMLAHAGTVDSMIQAMPPTAELAATTRRVNTILCPFTMLE